MTDEYTLSEKLFSGRRFLVLMAGVVFLLFGFSVALCIPLYIENKDAMVIVASMFGQLIMAIMLVYNKFFDKDRKNGNGNGGH